MALQDLGNILKEPKLANPIQDLASQGNQDIKTIHREHRIYLSDCLHLARAPYQFGKDWNIVRDTYAKLNS